MSAATAGSTTPSNLGRLARTYLPPQHGAWAFLALPLSLGAVVAPPAPPLLLLAIAWIAAYPLSYAVLGMVRSPRPQRFRRPAVAWACVVLPASAALAVVQPWLILVGVAYLLAFGINAVYARRHDERALGNDLVFIAECAAMVSVTWAVGATASTSAPVPDVPVPTQVWVLTAVCALVLVGSTLHVKSLIRERSDPRYALASRGFALGCLPLSLVLAAAWGLPSGLWLIAPFLVLAVRAVRPMPTPQRPGTIGLIELGCFVITAAASALAVTI